MTDSQWRLVWASVVGKSHAASNTPCQDYSICRTLSRSDSSELLVAVVSDGAGSAERSQEGAELACNLFVAEISDFIERGNSIETIDRTFMLSWLERFRANVAALAENAGLNPRSYACTLVAGIFDDRCAVFVQKGDGAIVVGDGNGEYAWQFWPQSGEYENVTFFLTDETTDDKLEVEMVQTPQTEVAIFTDGLQRLALNYAERRAHAPFFAPMFAPLHKEPAGYCRELSRKLEVYLQTDKINERSDDDKSLILAFRNSN